MYGKGENELQTPQRSENGALNQSQTYSTISTHWKKLFTNELKGIKSFGLVLKATNVLEIIFWSTIFIGGMIWAWIFLFSEVQSWQGNPSVVSNKNVKLSDIPIPAITFCSQSSTKFAIAERLGNYLNPDKKLPDELIEIREVMVQYLTGTYYKFVKYGYGAQCGPRGCKVNCNVIFLY